MKNLINTNKYLLAIQTVLILAVFVVAKPVLADDYTGGSYTGDYTGGSYTNDYTGGSYTNDYTGGSYANDYTGGSYTNDYTGGYSNPGTTYTNPGNIYTYGNTYSNPGTTYTYGDTYTNPGSVYTYGDTYSNPGSVYTYGDTYSNPGYNYTYGGTYTYPDPVYYSTSTYTVDPITGISGAYTYPTSMNYTPSQVAYSGYTYTPGTYTGDTVPNQVLAYTDTRNPQLSSVYLSDVPYTGAGDSIRIISFILAIIAWSLFVTFMILRKKVRTQLAEVSANENVKTDNNESYISSLDSDSRDIANIETYARENKVLLSTDAATKLVKLERLNKAKAKELINKISGGEWKAIGEKDVEKYL